MSTAVVEKEPAPAAPKRGISLAVRSAFVVCGVGLLVGFFLPWFTVGELISVSGVGLVFADGQMVSMLSGANRLLLFAIPALSIALLVCGIFGYRAAPWAAVSGSVVILGYGLFTLMRLFLSSTGPGMWLVIGSSLLALAFGLLDLGRRSKAS
jgi:hypothetical protein